MGRCWCGTGLLNLWSGILASSKAGKGPGSPWARLQRSQTPAEFPEGQQARAASPYSSVGEGKGMVAWDGEGGADWTLAPTELPTAVAGTKGVT